MKKKKSILLRLVLITIILIAGLLIKQKFIFNEKSAVSGTSLKNVGIPTDVIDVSMEKMFEELNYVGTVQSENNVVLSPKITSQILTSNVKEGDYINKGDIIATLDGSQLTATRSTTLRKIETAQSNYTYLKNQVSEYYKTNPTVKKIQTMELNLSYLKDQEAKYKELYDNGVIAKDAYDKIKHEKDTAQMQQNELKAVSDDAYGKLSHERDMIQMQLKELGSIVNELDMNIKETNIVAPISGRITKIFGEIGSLAMLGKPLIEIDNVENTIIKVNVGEIDLSKISTGMKAIVNITGTDENIESKVINVMPSVNPNTRIGEVEIGPINFKDKTRVITGSSVGVKFVISEPKEGVVLKKAFIKDINGKKMAYVVKDGIAHEREIKAGLVVDENVLVESGLNVGEKIAYKNLSKLYNGAKVYIFKGADN